jgi:hypothetical protein
MSPHLGNKLKAAVAYLVYFKLLNRQPIPQLQLEELRAQGKTFQQHYTASSNEQATKPR